MGWDLGGSGYAREEKRTRKLHTHDKREAKSGERYIVVVLYDDDVGYVCHGVGVTMIPGDRLGARRYMGGA